jgi:hypothetical protein
MRNRRILAGVLGATLALGVAGAAFADVVFTQQAQLPISLWDFADNNSSDACTADVLATINPGDALVHFVLNQTTATDPQLTVEFANADTYGPASATSSNNGTFQWTFTVTGGASDSITAVTVTDATDGNLQLSHVCAVAAPTPTPTLPPTNTIDQTPTQPAGMSLTLVFGLILAVAGGLVAYAMRPRRSMR